MTLPPPQLLDLWGFSDPLHGYGARRWYNPVFTSDLFQLVLTLRKEPTSTLSLDPWLYFEQ